MSALPKIHFEGYEDEAGRWPALIFPEVLNVATLNAAPIEGMRVMTYTGTLPQGEATLHWDEDRGQWLAVDWQGQRTPRPDRHRSGL